MKSIFDELKNALGSQYISDIKNESPLKILNAIGRMELSDYSHSELSGLSGYISENEVCFENHLHAGEHFKRQLADLSNTEVEE